MVVGRPSYGRRTAVLHKNLNLKISNFNWPGLGPVRAVPSVRAVPPSPGQLKFEILRKNRKKNETKRPKKERTKTQKTKVLREKSIGQGR